MTQEELKKVLQTVNKNIRCPSCGKKYDFGHIHIKGFVNNLCFLELNCPDHLPLFATIAAPQNKDLGAEKNEVIDNDYIIQAYQALHNYQGRISDLIK
jgi:hypothetical protein